MTRNGRGRDLARPDLDTMTTPPSGAACILPRPDDDLADLDELLAGGA
jgi:hypothetical protein